MPRTIRLIYYLAKIAGSSGKILATTILVIVFIISLQYYRTEIYKKQPSRPFTGQAFYNPYASYRPTPIKANFHAHSKAYLNLTNGHQSPELVYQTYKDSGYQIASLSNYQKITHDPTAPIYVPVYEHGYNIKKYHQLVINADKVSYFDFALFQSHHQKQQVIKRLKTNDNLIVLAHPALNKALEHEDLNYLQGYDLMEVYTHYKPSSKLWDISLSAGFPIWLLASDDTHNIFKKNDAFRRWNRIYTSDFSTTGVVKALKNGCHYGVKNSKSNIDVNWLDSCLVENGTVKVFFRQKADSIRFITDNGIISQKEFNKSNADYVIHASNSYVRIEAYTGTESIILNPVIRYNGSSIYTQAGFPPIDRVQTALYRLLILGINGLILLLILAINGKIKLVRTFPKITITIGQREIAI